MTVEEEFDLFTAASTLLFCPLSILVVRAQTVTNDKPLLASLFKTDGYRMFTKGVFCNVIASFYLAAPLAFSRYFRDTNSPLG